MTKRQIEALYGAGCKAIPDEMKRAAVTHGIELQEKAQVITVAEKKAWMLHGIKPERYRKKETK